jgi:hypothetical protein
LSGNIYAFYATSGFTQPSILLRDFRMNREEKEYIAKVINYFSGANIVTPKKINDHVATVAYEALQRVRTCSAAVDMVPRPTYSSPGIKYIVKELVGIGKRIAKNGDDIYYICKLAVSDAYRTKIRLSLIGL